jgi:transcriptional regulator with XRE-family HTH domain/tetratricopeptide (TPR) repeat protein
MSANPAAFGVLLAVCRRAAGLSQQELAERSGLSVRAVGNLERGRVVVPHPGTVHRLAGALELREPDRQVFLAAAERRLAGPGPLAPRQLPGPVRYFTGRSAELADLAGLAGQMPDSGGGVLICVISGMAGVGKTALALYWAHQAAAEFPDGQLYVNLRGFGPSGPPVPPDEALRGFLHVLGAPPQSIPGDLQAQASLLRSLLAGKRMLLILDNARDTAQVRPLLPGGPGCAVVVTSRSQLTSLVAAEGARPIALAPFTQAEALELLSRRLGAGRVADEPGATSALIRLCARLPLALAIVAARALLAPGVPLAAFAAELQNAATRLDALSAEGDGGSVRALFAWSYQGLGETSARMFRLLSLHPGPDISVTAAASLAGLPLRPARRALAELTGAHLVTEYAAGRFALHDLLRPYAGELSADSDTGPEQDTARRRIFDHYLYAAGAAVKTLYPAADELPPGPLEPGTVQESPATRDAARVWLATEHQVLLAVSRLAAEAGFDSYAARLPLALATYLDRSGRWQDCAATQCIALAALQRTGDRAGQARAHRFLGRALIRLGSYDTGRAHLTQAMSMFRELGDPLGQARCHLAIALLFYQQASYQDALAHAEDALPLYAAAGHRLGQAAALNHIAAARLYAGDPARALACSRQALAMHRELGNTEGEAEALDTIGCASQHLGWPAEAITYCQQAISLFGKTGNQYNQAEALTHLADAHQAAGDTGKAQAARLRALAILDSLNHPDAEPIRAKLDE